MRVVERERERETAMFRVEGVEMLRLGLFLGRSRLLIVYIRSACSPFQRAPAIDGRFTTSGCSFSCCCCEKAHSSKKKPAYLKKPVHLEVPVHTFVG